MNETKAGEENGSMVAFLMPTPGGHAPRTPIDFVDLDATRPRQAGRRRALKLPSNVVGGQALAGAGLKPGRSSALSRPPAF
jgi:hypothetical protein